MSNNSWVEGGRFFDDEELSQIQTRCRELRKEKDMLRESQSQSIELIKRLEQHVKSLSEALAEDETKIQKLEKELLNSTQEIEYLQDQLHARNMEVYELVDQVHELELKLADQKALELSVCQLTGDLQRSDSERLKLEQKLQSKEVELQRSAFSVEKLEESISALSLDSQCEIESMKLDLMSLDQACKEARKLHEVSIQEKSGMREFIEELEAQLYDSEEIRKDVEKENRELREKLVTSDRNLNLLASKIESLLEDNTISQPSTWYSSELETTSTKPKERNTHGWDLGTLTSKLTIVLEPALTLKEQVNNMSHQISEYEVLVMQLKEELREEKLKAKEEAEDLTQEMAELRYQMTCLLEEECKRRACIEQASLQRIAELEAQIQKQLQNSIAAIR